MNTTKNYQNLNTELDTIVAALQAPDLDIDEALELYRRGQKVIKALEAYLQKAENVMRTLSSEAADH